MYPNHIAGNFQFEFKAITDGSETKTYCSVVYYLHQVNKLGDIYTRQNLATQGLHRLIQEELNTTDNYY